jgi:hypothetical protein
MTTATQDVERYIRSLRNPHKRDYAIAYAEYLSEGATGEPPLRGSLSYIAAQAVRLELESISNA